MAVLDGGGVSQGAKTRPWWQGGEAVSAEFVEVGVSGERDKPWEASYEKLLACRSAPPVGVERCGGCGDGGERGFGVDPQAAQAGMAAFGHQQRKLDSGFGQVCQPRVPQLVQCPAAGGFLEYFSGSSVGQPCPTRLGVNVGSQQRS